MYAARFDDPIAHTSALAGLVGVAIVGAVAGAALSSIFGRLWTTGSASSLKMRTTTDIHPAVLEMNSTAAKLTTDRSSIFHWS
jgi:hypothetical protein